MIHRGLRQQFQVMVCGSDFGDGLAALLPIIQSSGYSYFIENSNDKEGLKKAIFNNPPHIVLFKFTHHSNSIKLINDLSSLLPEVHLIALYDSHQADEVYELFNEGLFDALSFPLQKELLHASLNRAALADLNLYSSEAKESVPDTGSDIENLISITKNLAAIKNKDQIIDSLMRDLSLFTQCREIIFLKYVPEKSFLVVERGIGWPAVEMKDIGIDLKGTEIKFNPLQVKFAQSLRGIEEFARVGLERDHFVAYSLMSGDSVCGVFLFTSRDPLRPWPNTEIQLLLEFASNKLNLLTLENKLARNSNVDEVSGALSREAFMMRLEEEVERSKRTGHSLGFILIKLDNYHDFALAHDFIDVERFLKAVSSLVVKHKRTTDIWGRLSDDNFALVLPYTDLKGAAIKAERLRRIVEVANFSRVLDKSLKVTISQGVSEFPQLAKSVTEILKTADSALTEVIRSTKNKVCIAKSLEPNQ